MSDKRTHTPERVLMDWMDAHNVGLIGSTPAMLVSVLRSAGHMDPVEPRTITTAEELDALPEGATVLSIDYKHFGGGWRVFFQRWGDGAWHRGGRSASTDPDYILPATVLYEPDAKQDCDGSAKCDSPSHVEGCFATNPDYAQ